MKSNDGWARLAIAVIDRAVKDNDKRFLASAWCGEMMECIHEIYSRPPQKGVRQGAYIYDVFEH